VHRALGNSESDAAFVHINEGDIGIGTDADVCAAQLDFGPTVGVGEDAISGSNRVIEVRLAPVIATRELNGDGAVDDG
jgi:hypothetical protein